jgi:hypothetical protein
VSNRDVTDRTPQGGETAGDTPLPQVENPASVEALAQDLAEEWTSPEPAAETTAEPTGS